MKTLKTTFLATLIAGGLFALSPALRAADTNKPPANPPPGAPPAGQHTSGPGGQVFLDNMAKQLELKDEQKPKFQAIIEEQRHKMHALRQSPDFKTLSPEERNAKVKAIHDDTATKMKSLLTPEQFDKWQKIPKGGPGMHEHHGKPPGGPAGNAGAPPVDAPKQ